MSGFVIRSLYTRAWNTWIEPSSDDDANSGYVGWNCTERSAREWYLKGRGKRTDVLAYVVSFFAAWAVNVEGGQRGEKAGVGAAGRGGSEGGALLAARRVRREGRYQKGGREMGRCHIRRRSVSELRASMTRAVQTDTYMEGRKKS